MLLLLMPSVSVEVELCSESSGKDIPEDVEPFKKKGIRGAVDGRK